MNFIAWIILGALAGWIAGNVMKGGGFGLLGNILVGIVINLVFVYVVLRSSAWLERVIGKAGFAVLRRIFGVILLAIAVKIFKDHVFPS